MQKETGVIKGDKIALRPATAGDKRLIYEWLAESDATCAMMGPPKYPDAPVPTWEEFCADYEPYFFDGSRPELGRCYIITAGDLPVGQINYGEIDKRNRRTELDIWMSSESDCGRGYGPDALQTLCNYLNQTYGVVEFVIRPSARNLRAVRAYEKAGFRLREMTDAEQEAEYGPRDYKDSVVLIRRHREEK